VIKTRHNYNCFTSSSSCITLAEHVFHFETNVLMLGLHSMPFCVLHMQGKSIPMRKLPMIKYNNTSDGYIRWGWVPTWVEKTFVLWPFRPFFWLGWANSVLRQTPHSFSNCWNQRWQLLDIFSGIDDFADEVTYTRDVERTNRRWSVKGTSHPDWS
jgi:hypothetical protein